MFGSAASPILYKDRLIVTASAESESILALDKNSGDEIWRAEASTLSRCYCTPLIVTNAKGEDELLIVSSKVAVVRLVIAMEVPLIVNAERRA